MYVFPDDVTPYVKINWFRPSKNSFNLGKTISLKICSCSDAGENILLNVKLWDEPRPFELLYVLLSFGAFRMTWSKRCARLNMEILFVKWSSLIHNFCGKRGKHKLIATSKQESWYLRQFQRLIFQCLEFQTVEIISTD